MRMRFTPSWLQPAAVIAAVLTCAGVSVDISLAQPLRAGYEVPFVAASPHPYRSATEEAPFGTEPEPIWSARIEHPGATFIAVHFDRFELAPGDLAVVRSESGLQRYVFTGRGKGDLGTFWATHIKGDRAIVELFARGRSKPAWGLSIDQYSAGTVDLGKEAGAATESICSGEDRQHAICYQFSEPEIYDNSRAVARLLIEGTFLCTGWLVGCQGHLFTNNHCIDDPDLSDPPTAVVNTDYEFMGEAPSCGSGNCQLCFRGPIWPGDAMLVRSNKALDYAFIRLDGDPQATYGSFFLDNRAAVADERIYFPQHPLGHAKEIGVFSADPTDESGFCEVWSPSTAAGQGTWATSATRRGVPPARRSSPTAPTR